MNKVKEYLYKLIEKTSTEELPDILDLAITIVIIFYYNSLTWGYLKIFSSIVNSGQS